MKRVAAGRNAALRPLQAALGEVGGFPAGGPSWRRPGGLRGGFTPEGRTRPGAVAVPRDCVFPEGQPRGTGGFLMPPCAAMCPVGGLLLPSGGCSRQLRARRLRCPAGRPAVVAGPGGPHATSVPCAARERLCTQGLEASKGGLVPELEQRLSKTTKQNRIS